MEAIPVLQQKVQNLEKNAIENTYMISNLIQTNIKPTELLEIISKLMQDVGVESDVSGILKSRVVSVPKVPRPVYKVQVSVTQKMSNEIRNCTFGKGSRLSQINQKNFGDKRDLYIYVELLKTDREKAEEFLLNRLKMKLMSQRTDSNIKYIVKRGRLIEMEGDKLIKSENLRQLYHQNIPEFMSNIKNFNLTGRYKNEVELMIKNWQTPNNVPRNISLITENGKTNENTSPTVVNQLGVENGEEEALQAMLCLIQKNAGESQDKTALLKSCSDIWRKRKPASYELDDFGNVDPKRTKEATQGTSNIL